MRFQAKWIWKSQKNPNPYNQTILAQKTLQLPAFGKAVMAITADTEYRLFVNGQWVNDGPARGWPDHYYYDLIDLTPCLRPGANEIRIIARHYGVGTFHQVPQQAGLLAQLDVTPLRGRPFSVGTDKSWRVAELKAWTPDTPLVSLQQGPSEAYDARLERGIRFSQAAELFGALDGPYKKLSVRDTPLLTREPRCFREFQDANIVNREWLGFTFPVARLLHPGLIEANSYVSVACGIATVIQVSTATRVRIDTVGLDVRINGKKPNRGVFTLQRGRNFLLAVVTDCFEHGLKEVSVRFQNAGNLKLINPLLPVPDNPWVLAPFEEAAFEASDMVFFFADEPEREAVAAKFQQARRSCLRQITGLAAFKRAFGSRARLLPREKMVLTDPHAQFKAREVVADGGPCIDNPTGLIYDNAEYTVIHPSARGDIELVYDLGEQSCGYILLDLIADEGTVVDVFGVEYIAPDGAVQHTGKCRNGFRYTCKQGQNRFMSFKRRSARHVFITLRNQKAPVRIRNIQMIESTYPVSRQGQFSCSEPMLDRIWAMSARTLQLCMEDTFTDCPLYEQTLWVGDARNEALFAYTAFGAVDIARRFITLAGQSLDRFPIVGAQVPSSWEMLLPAWSFLWGMAVWEHYFYTGDRTFLAHAWKWVKQNLDGAVRLTDDRGLFSGPFWNMFDWSPKDNRFDELLRKCPQWARDFRTGNDFYHRTVVYNSILLVGAIDAAVKCAEVLEKREDRQRLKNWRQTLCRAINRLWDGKKQAYPDSIHDNGTISEIVSQHSSYLSVLYDVVPAAHRAAAIRDTMKPSPGMVEVGSPFGMFFQYEAMEKAGLQDEIVESIRRNYVPMVEAGATTVWEAFPSGALGYGKFPTRSHCHAWSAGPIHFLNRIVLGIRQTEPGCRAFEISPRLNGLSWAKGATATPHGPVAVKWENKSNQLHITVSAPKNVKLRFAPNDSHKGLKVDFTRTRGRAIV